MEVAASHLSSHPRGRCPAPAPTQKGVIVMLGAPGVGKSTLGKFLAQRLAAKFVSIGDCLREKGAVDFRKKQAPVDQFAQSILQVELVQFMEQCAEKILVLECVKDLNGAHQLFDTLETLELTFSGAIFLIPPHGQSYPSRTKHETEKIHHARQEKFYAQLCPLLELFSSTGNLMQVRRDPVDKTVSESRGSPFEKLAEFGPGDIVEVSLGKALQTAGLSLTFSRPEVSLQNPTIRGALADSKDFNCFTYNLCDPIISAAAEIPEEIEKALFSALKVSRECPLTVKTADLRLVSRTESSATAQNCLAQVASFLRKWYGSESVQVVQPLVSTSVVRSKTSRESVLQALVVMLDINRESATDVWIQVFSMPSGLLQSDKVLQWLLEPGRYVVSRKCDGTRCLLILFESEVFFLNRAGTLYQYSDKEYSLEDGTVLDGEVISLDPSAPPSFVVFDVLCKGGAKLWHLPFDRRQAELLSLLAENKSHTGKGLIHQKQYWPASADSVSSLLSFAVDPNSQTSQEVQGKDYPSDGLVFTPRETPYRFGPDALLVKWKPQEAMSVDLDAAMIKALQIAQYQLPDSEQNMDPTQSFLLSRRPVEAARESEHITSHVDTSAVQKWPFFCQVTATANHYPPGRRMLVGGAAARPTPDQQDANLAAGVVFECKLTSTLPSESTGKDFDPISMVSRLVTHVEARSGGADPTGGQDSRMALTESGWIKVNQPYRRQPLKQWLAQRSSQSVPPQSLVISLVRVRFDKAQANSSSVIANTLLGPTMSSSDVRKALQTLRDNPTPIQLKRFLWRLPNPASLSMWGQGFEALYRTVETAVSSGTVERHDSQGFQVYNSLGAVGAATLPWCRGLVLHPQSKSVVTKPCFRFPDRGKTAGSSLNSEQESPDSGKNTRGSQVTVSEKIDGSYGVGFLWHGSICICSRRRMTSEQAVWATEWSSQHLDPDSMRDGWTYLFEIVSSTSRVVTNYAYEGLVLLSATDPAGTEVCPEDRIEMACALGIPHASQMACWPDEVSTLCELTECEQSEGWVVERQDGARYKMVHDRWQQSWCAMQKLQPQLVWEALKFSKELRITIPCLPSHGLLELDRMCNAIERSRLQLQHALAKIQETEQFKTCAAFVETLRQQSMEASKSNASCTGAFNVVVSPFQEAFFLAEALANAQHPHNKALQRDEASRLCLHFLALRGGVFFLNACDAAASTTLHVILKDSQQYSTRVCFHMVSMNPGTGTGGIRELHSSVSSGFDRGPTLEERLAHIRSAIMTEASSGPHRFSECNPFANSTTTTNASGSFSARLQVALKYRTQFVLDCTTESSAPVASESESGPKETCIVQLFATASVNVLSKRCAVPDQWNAENWKKALQQALARMVSGDVVMFEKTRRQLTPGHKVMRTVLHDVLLSEQGSIRGYQPSASFQCTFCKSWPTLIKPSKMRNCPDLLGHVTFTCIAKHLLESNIDSARLERATGTTSGGRPPAGMTRKLNLSNNRTVTLGFSDTPLRKGECRRIRRVLAKAAAVCKEWYSVLADMYLLQSTRKPHDSSFENREWAEEYDGSDASVDDYDSDSGGDFGIGGLSFFGHDDYDEYSGFSDYPRRGSF